MAAKTESTRTGRRRPMQFTYASTPKEHIRYTLKTDPPDAIYWTTYRLKKSDVVLLDKFDKATTALIKQEIFDDILSTEPNPSSKSKTTINPIQEKRKVSQPQYVKTRKTKRKAG